MRENGDPVIFHILRAPLKLYNCGRKLTSLVFSSKCHSEPWVWPSLHCPQWRQTDRESVQRVTWNQRGLSAHLCFQSLFQTRRWGIHPAEQLDSTSLAPIPEDCYENRDFRDTSFLLPIQSLVTHNPLSTWTSRNSCAKEYPPVTVFFNVTQPS